MGLQLGGLGLLQYGAPLFILLAAIAAPSGAARFGAWCNLLAFIAAVSSAFSILTAAPGASLAPWVSPAAASHLVVVLITFLGLIIGRFAQTYLVGEAGARRFMLFFQCTLLAVVLTVLADHLLVLFAGLVVISLCLHQLLLFYPQRSRAALAAHKKFIVARTAEILVLTAAVLLHEAQGTWSISAIVSAYAGGAALSAGEQAAAVLIALAALLKCAQLPVHGWLIQVVEAPTPVSALLHAGIVNLGGYLLILFAPLLMASGAARWTLLIIAGLSLVLSSLIMTTRISIKVKLAWSTVAQMALMLIQCALGLFELALLHLMAHGIYKAYKFLSAGSAVEDHLVRQLAKTESPGPAGWIVAAVMAVPLVAATSMELTPDGPFSPWFIAAGFLTVLVARHHTLMLKRPFTVSLGLGAVCFVAYLAQKSAISVAIGASAAAIDPLADAWFIVLFSLLTVGWFVLRGERQSAFHRRVHAWLFGGLFLDEWMSRLTLKLWPMRLPVRVRPKQLATELRAEAD